MKVILINAVYGLSSTGRTVKQLCERLEDYGFEASSVFFAGCGTEKDFRMNSDFFVKVHAVLARITGKEGYYSAIATRRMLKYLKEQKPDIVHIHNLHSNFINIPMLFKYLAKKGIPTSVTLHDCWWYTGKCTHYTADGCYKWLDVCGDCPRLKKDIPSLFFDRTKTLLRDKKKWFSSVRPLAVIGVSDWITREAKKSFLGNADIIERVYNWIDTDVFIPTESDVRKRYGIENKYLVLAVASRWIATKGTAAFVKLAQKLPDDIVLVMIGKLPQNVIIDHPQIITIPETESQHELAQWYSSADVFLSLSKEESFGKVTAEALACGTPVISYNSTACPELVGENCGIVIDSDDPSTVIEAIKVLKNRGKASMTSSCREFAVKNFHMEENIAAIADIYRRLYFLKVEEQ